RLVRTWRTVHTSRVAEENEGRRAPFWTLMAVLVSGASSFVFLVLPARGLTFLHDDWVLLDRFLTEPWPRRWLLPHNDHFMPLSLTAMLTAFLALERHLARGRRLSLALALALAFLAPFFHTMAIGVAPLLALAALVLAPRGRKLLPSSAFLLVSLATVALSLAF